MTATFRILHVDDNPLDRHLVRDALENESDQFLVITAESREEYETQLAKGGYHLILTDFNILGFEGLQIVDDIHRKNLGLPVIVLTGTGSEEIAVEAMKRGASDYIIKNPQHIRRLPIAILSALEWKRLKDERLQTQEALRVSEEHLSAVISGTPIILFVLDRAGVFTLLQGQGLSAIKGLDPADYLGRSFFEFFEVFGEFPSIREHFRRALAGEETEAIQKLGDVVLDIRYSRLHNKAGEVSGIIGVATDITERLKAERLRVELEKEQEVIALKERFIATASHDFRTPLTIIKTTASMLDTYFNQMSSSHRSAKLRQIYDQVDQMTRLLDDVLTLSKANAGKIVCKPERVQLRAFCGQIWDDFRHIAQKTHTIDFIFNCEQDEVIFDPNLIHYILVNLLSNAVKYSPENGYVRFEVIHTHHEMIFRISDNGIGIPEADQAKLFQPFHRATNTQGIEGTGLGLSIVKTYVEAHGGSIEVSSQEGRGTAFTVQIPIG